MYSLRYFITISQPLLEPGRIVASGVSRIHVAGITTDLWTPTKFLSKRPVENSFGVVETPETSGLVPIETESNTDSLKQAGVTPAPSTNSTPHSDENERP